MDSPWRIEFRSSAKASLRQLPESIRREIFAEILDLRFDPFPAGSIQLSGLNRLYRVRVGGYRVVYRVTRSRNVIIERIRPRAEVYRGFPEP